MNNLILKKQHFIEKHNSVTLLSVLRDELLLLPYFIDYYKQLGVDNFIFIDNNSNDGSLQYLFQRRDVNITLYHTTHSYKEALYGTKWINMLLDKYCKDKWCIVVDIDELLYSRENNIHHLIDKMEKQNCNLSYQLLLDMYPKSTNINDYQTGTNFIQHSNYYDKYSPEYNIPEYPPNNTFLIKGGIRKRLFGTDNTITKTSLFKYTFYNNLELDVGYHLLKCRFCGELWKNDPDRHYLLENIKIYPEMNILLHFKFIKPNLIDFFTKRIHNNQDWDNSSEYQNYLDNFKTSFYNEKYSIKYLDKTKLYLDMTPYLKLLENNI